MNIHEQWLQKGESSEISVVLEGRLETGDKAIRGILTAETVDRDNEVVDIGGLDITNFLMNPVLVDSHNYRDSVVSRVLGKFTNVKKETRDGVKRLAGDIEFANTPSGQIAKHLVEDGFVSTLSIGFGVKEYDVETNRILKSELYECSLVAVPSNVSAQIMKSKGISEEEVPTELEKILLNYKEIHPKIKEYRKLILEDLAKFVGFEPQGNELIDLQGLLDIIYTRLSPSEIENLEPKEVVKTSLPLIDWEFVKKSLSKKN